MTPEISEFSYGFALTHELLKSLGGSLRTAPIFPSLIEEGRTGGGYDVNLKLPGFPLFLQFKRSDCMKRKNAKELSLGTSLQLPFYRMKITEKNRSDQHELLLALDVGFNQVFYVAPKFHTVDELNSNFFSNIISKESIFVRPRAIGKLDDKPHHVSFDSKLCYLCSEPRRINAIKGTEFLDFLHKRILADKRPINEGPLDEILAIMETALVNKKIGVERQQIDGSAKPEGQRKLRLIADLALYYFGTQLFVIQHPWKS